MTDTTTTTTRTTLDDLAHQAVSDPSTLQPADITRLGTFVVDHVEHLAFARRVADATSGGPSAGRVLGPLGKRLEATAQLQHDGDKLPPVGQAIEASGEAEQHQEA